LNDLRRLRRLRDLGERGRLCRLPRRKLIAEFAIPLPTTAPEVG